MLSPSDSTIKNNQPYFDMSFKFKSLNKELLNSSYKLDFANYILGKEPTIKKLQLLI